MLQAFRDYVVILYFNFKTCFLDQRAFGIDDLYHVDILGIYDQNIFGGHGETGFYGTFKTYKILVRLPDGF